MAGSARAQTEGVVLAPLEPTPTTAPTPSAPPPAGASAPAGSPDGQERPESPALPAGAAAPVIPAASSEEVAAMKATLADVTARLEALTARQEEAEAALTAIPSEGEIDTKPLEIYGFADFGVQRVWTPQSSVLRALLGTNSTSFVIGNLNLYFDAQPVAHWRTLIEVRFTNAPQGEVIGYGGLAGSFRRENTQQIDPHGTVPNAPMWRGSTVIERAWVEWRKLEGLKLRLGNWFTPFGIWNEDHGTPTLIPLALPQSIIQAWMPLRQTGIQLRGSSFAGEWELAYMLTLSNGRQELSNFNFGDSLGYGGRVFARRETGDVNTTGGLSFFTGTNEDRSIDVVGITPITLQTNTIWKYREYVAGADVSLDIGSTRLRTEAILRRLIYEPGKRPPAQQLLGTPGAFEADRWMQAIYLTVAHELPWAGLEPFIFTELTQTFLPLGDGTLTLAVGLNWHFNSAITWKTQLSRGVFFDWLYEGPELGNNDATGLYSRIVMAF